MADTSYTHMFKIVLLGDSAVGKSQMLQRFTKGKFTPTYSTTVGAEFATKDIQLKNGVNVKVQIWDTAGQEKFRTITRAFYRGAVGALLVYDVTKVDTFDSCEKWMKEIKSNTSENQVAILLVGNKIDLVPTQYMHTQSAIDFAQKNNLALYSSSALTGENIDTVFQTLVEEIYSQIEKNQQSGVVQQKESISNNKSQESQQQQQQREKQQSGTNDNKQLNKGQHQGSILTHPSSSKKNKKQESDCSC